MTSLANSGIKLRHRQTYAVWEITLKCNLACSHCGSRAGDSRVNELSTSEALDLVQQMAELGIEDVSLIGGEAFLRPDWLIIAAEITRLGMNANMTTGGYGIS
ncbi:radical SAM protein, partial [Rheinheimera sp.]